MLDDGSFSELYNDFAQLIEDRQLLDAFIYLVGKGVTLKHYQCSFRPHEGVNAIFRISEGTERTPFSVIVTDCSMTFCVHNPPSRVSHELQAQLSQIQKSDNDWHIPIEHTQALIDVFNVVGLDRHS
ncbi:hypothetical protein K0504_10430 [Neiella marina]|uniref:Uncharacterized protein n=1 Tax=Neiella holothuriorum TaxID=2870530 RepID=A0ABS7EII1_9GAMM|nr:hypothetical protein [Neiella holothuriorum]MBW8191452.1 hypothetical protein [Neiella holothuriorum]